MRTLENDFQVRRQLLLRGFVGKRAAWLPLILVAFVVHFAHLAIAEGVHGYTVGSVAQGMVGAQAKFTDLQLNYVTKEQNHKNGSVTTVRILDGIYAHKKSKDRSVRFQYLERKVSIYDPNTKRLTRLVVDSRSIFDGEKTEVLDRIGSAETKNLMEAHIYASYSPAQFRYEIRDPNTEIWDNGRRLIASIITDPKNDFHVAGQSEPINGLPCVRLVGKNGNNVVTLALWVCPERGFLPMKRQLIHRDYGLLYETALYDIVELSDGMWYPKTIRSPADPPGRPDVTFSTVWEISRLSIEPIPEAFFKPPIPPKTHVFDTANGISYTTY